MIACCSVCRAFRYGCDNDWFYGLTAKVTPSIFSANDLCGDPHWPLARPRIAACPEVCRLFAQGEALVRTPLRVRISCKPLRVECISVCQRFARGRSARFLKIVGHLKPHVSFERLRKRRGQCRAVVFYGDAAGNMPIRRCARCVPLIQPWFIRKPVCFQVCPYNACRPQFLGDFEKFYKVASAERYARCV